MLESIAVTVAIHCGNTGYDSDDKNRRWLREPHSHVGFPLLVCCQLWPPVAGRVPKQQPDREQHLALEYVVIQHRIVGDFNAMRINEAVKGPKV